MTTNYVNGQDMLAFTNQNGITGTWTAGDRRAHADRHRHHRQLPDGAALDHLHQHQRRPEHRQPHRQLRGQRRHGEQQHRDPQDRSVTAVNDAPVNTVPGAQTTATNTAKVFSSGNGNLISITDADAAAGIDAGPADQHQRHDHALRHDRPDLHGRRRHRRRDDDLHRHRRQRQHRAGGLSFNPTTGFTGAASLQIVTNDQGNTGSGGTLTDTDTVTITVDADTAPTAVADSYPVNEDTLLTVAVGSGVLVNDSDPQSDPLTAALVSDVANGALALSADGSFTYQPAPTSTASDSFTYKANDGQLDSNVGDGHHHRGCAQRRAGQQRARRRRTRP